MSGSYAPVLRIDLRSSPHGGPPLAAVREVWSSGNGISQRQLVVLVHGYNNSQQEAEGAYHAFRRRELPHLTPGQFATLGDALGDAFWPGDADWGTVDKLDFLFYPTAVGVARTVAPAIATYLQSRKDVLEVHFIAHSLGCRVALEVIDLLRTRADAPRIGKVCLMAAAVPCFMVGRRGHLHAALQAPLETRVLHSRHDPVLATAFPPGQTLAGEGFFPEAVGRNGDVPVTPGRVEVRSIARAGHGSYWGQDSDAPSRDSGEQVRAFFGFASLPARSLPARSLGSRGFEARPNPAPRRPATA